MSDDAPRVAAPRGNGERILLVDDEEAIRRVGARMLRHAGYAVETAVDGHEAVELIQSDASRCDLVVLDGKMPRLGGQEAARRIREIRADLPLVLATGYLDGSTRDENDVFDGAIAKPYDMASLSRVVSALLGRPA